MLFHVLHFNCHCPNAVVALFAIRLCLAPAMAAWQQPAWRNSVGARIEILQQESRNCRRRINSLEDRRQSSEERAETQQPFTPPAEAEAEAETEDQSTREGIGVGRVVPDPAPAVDFTPYDFGFTIGNNNWYFALRSKRWICKACESPKWTMLDDGRRKCNVCAFEGV